MTGIFLKKKNKTSTVLLFLSKFHVIFFILNPKFRESPVNRI